MEPTTENAPLKPTLQVMVEERVGMVNKTVTQNRNGATIQYGNRTSNKNGTEKKKQAVTNKVCALNQSIQWN